MITINPKNLKALREKRRLTLDQLSQLSGVDRGTINKIERTTAKSRRSLTASRLASALGVEVTDLTSPSIAEADGSRIYGPKSQYNFQMAEDARNALILAADRYNVKPTAILHIAPLLFTWAAEASLQRRKEKLDEIHAGLRALMSLETPPHIGEVLLDHWNGDGVLEAERCSIAERDIFALTIPAEHLRNAPDYDREGDNPMSHFLTALTATLDVSVARFNSWCPFQEQLEYELCREDVEKLTGGDRGATHAILTGAAPLRSMPKSVREAGPEAVAAWALTQSNLHSRGSSHGDAQQELESDDE
jgi:transcriptional regulator with XRE-family HTH domain